MPRTWIAEVCVRNSCRPRSRSVLHVARGMVRRMLSASKL